VYSLSGIKQQEIDSQISNLNLLKTKRLMLLMFTRALMAALLGLIALADTRVLEGIIRIVVFWFTMTILFPCIAGIMLMFS